MTCTKQPYPHRRAAERAIREIRKRMRRGKSKDRTFGCLRPYPCDEDGCDAWHLTSTPTHTPARRRAS